MNARALNFVVVALVAVVVGAMLLKGFAGDGPNNPVVSTSNGHPRGLLAALRLLERKGVDVTARRQHEDPIADGLLIMPPPEAAWWSKQEVRSLLERVKTGAVDVLMLCDDNKARNRRFTELSRETGLACTTDAAPAISPVAAVEGLTIETLTGGGLHVADDVPFTPLASTSPDDGAEPVDTLIARRWGEGEILVLASASALANDGLARAGNAAWLLRLVGGRAVTIDDAHHQFRRTEVLSKAFGRPGPQAGLLALLLLVPLSLLAFLPRPGDAPPQPPPASPPAAQAAAEALAALYAEADLDWPTANDRPTGAGWSPPSGER